jgi:hypothetical protein
MARRPALLLTSLAGLLACAVVLGHRLAWAGPAAQATKAAAPAGTSAWTALSPAQRKALEPLQAQWPTLEEVSRDKWLNVAERYPTLGAAEQARMQERMTQWARLPAHERGEARLRFQQTRQLSAEDRQQKWAAYQALPATDRDDLTRQAQRKAKPVFLPDAVPGPREPSQVFGSKRQSPNQASARKSNVVPGSAAGTAPSPTVLTATVVKAGSGATTNLVNQQATPPLHQHTGLTKITASRTFVDPVTLLPRKGAQSAAMAPQSVKVSDDTD